MTDVPGARSRTIQNPPPFEPHIGLEAVKRDQNLLLPADAALRGEDLHGVFRGGHLPGLVLPDQPHPGRGRHGLRGAEPGDHRGGMSERTGVPGGHGETEEGPAGRAPGGQRLEKEGGELMFASSVISQAAAQKALDSDSVVSPELSPFALPLDHQEGRRQSQVLVGVAEAEANLSEEKLLQVDVTDGGKVRGEESGGFLPLAPSGG